MICKNPDQVEPKKDFYYNLTTPLANKKFNAFNYSVAPIGVEQIPGLNTLGISLARVDFNPNGIKGPHYHPRASKVIHILEGEFHCGFISKNTFYDIYLNKGDVYVFPQGTIHVIYNRRDDRPGAVLEVLNSQNPGLVQIPNAIFGSDPFLGVEVIDKAFKLDKKDLEVVNRLKDVFVKINDAENGKVMSM